MVLQPVKESQFRSTSPTQDAMEDDVKWTTDLGLRSPLPAGLSGAAQGREEAGKS